MLNSMNSNKGNTPLHYAIAYNNIPVLKLLLEKGANLTIKNKKVSTIS